MKRRPTLKVIMNAVVVIFCCSYLFPVYLVIVNAFKTRAELYENILAPPKSLTLEYFYAALEKMDFIMAFKNSIIVTVISVLIIVLLSAMTAWMFVRADNKLSALLLNILILTMLIPFQTIMMPLMQEMNLLGKLLQVPLKDSLGGLIFMYVGFGAGMGVFLFHGFIKASVPVSLEEAAIIDGCNTWRVFWQIVFPILKPITVTVAILDVIWIWNDYLLPSLTLTSIGNKTVPLAMSLFFGQYNIEWNMAMAALTFTIIPVVIFYLICQKYIIKGVAAGAVKG